MHVTLDCGNGAQVSLGLTDDGRIAVKVVGPSLSNVGSTAVDAEDFREQVNVLANAAPRKRMALGETGARLDPKHAGALVRWDKAGRPPLDADVARAWGELERIATSDEPG